MKSLYFILLVFIVEYAKGNIESSLVNGGIDTVQTQQLRCSILLQNGHIYFKIPNNFWEKDILIVYRFLKTSKNVFDGFVGYPGDQISSCVVRFVKKENLIAGIQSSIETSLKTLNRSTTTSAASSSAWR